MCHAIPNKNTILALLMFIFKKAMVFLSRNDRIFKRIISQLPDNYTFSVEVNFSDISVTLEKRNGVFFAASKKPADLKLVFINPCSAFLVFSGILAQHDAFAQQRISIKGSISDALILTKAINRLQYLIFPYPISKRLIKEPAPPTKRKRILSVKFYLYGLVK